MTLPKDEAKRMESGLCGARTRSGSGGTCKKPRLLGGVHHNQNGARKPCPTTSN